MARFCSIIHIIVCIQTRCLEGNFHILDDYNRYVRSMGGMVDELETELDTIEEEGDLIMNNEFMMGTF